jgi:organic radical activating enzyme
VDERHVKAIQLINQARRRNCHPPLPDCEPTQMASTILQLARSATALHVSLLGGNPAATARDDSTEELA